MVTKNIKQNCPKWRKYLYDFLTFGYEKSKQSGETASSRFDFSEKK